MTKTSVTNAHESSILTYASNDALDSRKEIFRRMNCYQATEEEKERSLGLFLRGALLARILAITHVYQKIIGIPGTVMDIGTWRGQTAVVCENLRAVYEPLNFNRRIICFDTFEGYKGFSDKDNPTNTHRDGTYAVGEDYATYLHDLLVLHERSNAMGHNNGKHSVIAGDCRKTLPAFFRDNANEFVALAFFDLNAYSPTAEALEAVYHRLVPGGILAFWQLTRAATPAEGRVYVEKVLGQWAHRLHYAPTYPGLCFIEKI